MTHQETALRELLAKGTDASFRPSDRLSAQLLR
jgi:hypothetical protein